MSIVEVFNCDGESIVTGFDFFQAEFKIPGGRLFVAALVKADCDLCFVFSLEYTGKGTNAAANQIEGAYWIFHGNGIGDAIAGLPKFVSSEVIEFVIGIRALIFLVSAGDHGHDPHVAFAKFFVTRVFRDVPAQLDVAELQSIRLVRFNLYLMAINTFAFGSAVIDLYCEQVVAGGDIDRDEGGNEGAFGPHVVADRPVKYGVLCAVNIGVGGVGQDDGAIGDNHGGVARSKGAHFYGVDAVVDFQAGGAI